MTSGINQCNKCKEYYSEYENKEKSGKDGYNGNLRMEKLSGSKTVFDYDFCPNCFDAVYDKIIPVVEEIFNDYD